MQLSRRRVLGAAIGTGLAVPRSGHAQPAGLRIGVLNDMSGNYRDTNGPTSVACVRQAVEDSGLAAARITVDVIGGDHQNKGDVGSAIARRWLDQDGVDVIVDVPVTAVALAVNQLVRERNKVYLNSSGATADLTGSECSPNTVKWTYDTYMLARSSGVATVQAGGSRWFFIADDYSFGQQLQRDVTRFVPNKDRHCVRSALPCTRKGIVIPFYPKLSGVQRTTVLWSGSGRSPDLCDAEFFSSLLVLLCHKMLIRCRGIADRTGLMILEANREFVIRHA